MAKEEEKSSKVIKKETRINGHKLPKNKSDRVFSNSEERGSNKEFTDNLEKIISKKR